MGRAELDRDLEIGAHAHAQLSEAVARGDPGEQREVQGRLLVLGRDRHQAHDRQAEIVAAGGDEGVGIGRPDACLLRLLAGVDLDEAGRATPLARHLAGERLGELRPVERLDHIEQRDHVLDLVGLDRPDHVQLEVRPGGAGARPARLGLLHVVLAEHALAGGERGPDPLLGLRLADRDQGHRRGRPVDRARSRLDARAHRAQVAFDRRVDDGLFGAHGYATFPRSRASPA